MKRVKCMLAVGIPALAAIVLLLPDTAEAQKKDKKTVNRATPEDYQQIRNLQEITGKIAFADETSNIVSLRVEVPQVQTSKGGNNRPKKGRPNYQLVKVPKDFDFTVQDKATVRQLFITAAYDDKGFLKDNQEQQKLLRSKGYIPAKLEDVKAGMTAKLYLTPPKAAAKDDAAKPTVKMIVLLQAAGETGGAVPKKNK